MIKDIKLWEEFENSIISENVPDFERNLKKFLKMKMVCSSLPEYKNRNIFEGIENTVKLAVLFNKRT